MFDRFTDRARTAIQLAHKEAQTLGHNYVGTEHLLFGLLTVDGGAAKALALCAPAFNTRSCHAEISKTARMVGGETSMIPFTPRTKEALRLAASAADAREEGFVSTEHILLGLLDQEGGMAQVMLHHFKIDFTQLRIATLDVLSQLVVKLP